MITNILAVLCGLMLILFGCFGIYVWGAGSTNPHTMEIGICFFIGILAVLLRGKEIVDALRSRTA